jgi:hypothetical protein
MTINAGAEDTVQVGVHKHDLAWAATNKYGSGVRLQK